MRQQSEKQIVAFEGIHSTAISIRLALATNTLKAIDAGDVNRAKILLRQAYESDLMALSYSQDGTLGVNEKSILDQANEAKKQLLKPM